MTSLIDTGTTPDPQVPGLEWRIDRHEDDDAGPEYMIINITPVVLGADVPEAAHGTTVAKAGQHYDVIRSLTYQANDALPDILRKQGTPMVQRGLMMLGVADYINEMEATWPGCSGRHAATTTTWSAAGRTTLESTRDDTTSPSALAARRSERGKSYVGVLPAGPDYPAERDSADCGA